MKKVLAIVLALLMILSLVACGGDKPTTSTPPASDTTTPGTSEKPADPKPADPKPTEPEKPAEPKIVKLSLETAPGNAWHSADSTSASRSIQALLEGKLYGTIPVDGKAALSPILADGEPIDVNGDGITWYIKINKDAKWENGDPINADTYMFTFKAMLDPKLVHSGGGNLAKQHVTVLNATEYYGQGAEGKTPVAWEDVGFKKIDEYTVQVTLAAPATAYLMMRHFSTRPVYQPLYEKCLSADGLSCSYGSSQDKIISSGPFKASNWVIGSVYEFVKNENYILADLVKLDGYTYTVVEDAGTRLQLFEKGELDYISLDAAAREKYGDDPRVVSISGRKVYCIEFNTANTEKAFLKNENFHLALFYATNRAELGKLIAQDPATGLVSPNSIAQSDGTTFRQLAAAKGYEAKNYGYDPALAKEYLDKALKEEGLTSIEVNLLVNSGSLESRAEYLQENWQTVFGTDKFKVNIDAKPSAQSGDLRKGWKKNPNGYEICYTSWSISASDWDPIQGLSKYNTAASSRNAPYDDPTVNAWYAEANNAENRLNMDKRNELALKIEEYMLEHAMVVPTTYESTYGLPADRIILPLGGYDSELGWGFPFCDIAQ